MSDWEDAFGPGNGGWLPPYQNESKEPSRKAQIFYKKKKEFNDTMIKLGFRWCIKHGIISHPRLSREAIFLDRKDATSTIVVGGFGGSRQKMLLSRLIIEPREHSVSITLITPKKMLKKEYDIKKKNAFKNAILIALDFKFSNKNQLINESSFTNDDIYLPLKS